MTDPATGYRVLARKYRPQTFAEVIGQDAMVRTLSNAISEGRIAQAFILTGVRGVGKTTTARIIARALNCIVVSGNGGPTSSPCGKCVHCREIAEDRHVDVIEMDAASHTQVDKMRELLDGVRYRPVLARFKIYIIDEVHMLSGHSFNALLKTLEEPPEHVKFIFATTEIRKVPTTVLSRCQRFSLRRVPIEQLIAHYQQIAAKEAVEITPAALGLIARAADGSVRDGLSLLDQAIALSAGRIEEAAVRDMLGIADRGLVFDLFETMLKGDAKGALGQMDSLYRGGADPLMIIQDLLDLTHFVTRLKLAPGAGSGDPLEQGDRERARPLIEALSIPVLTRAWQMLLKGVEEVQNAQLPAEAADMVLIRLAYAADLPVPAELVRALTDGDDTSEAALAGPAPPSGERAGVSGQPPGAEASKPSPSRAFGAPVSAEGIASASARAPAISAVPAAQPEAQPSVVPVAQLDPMPQSFAELIALFDKRREALIRSHLCSHVHLVAFEPGRIEFRPQEAAPRDLANRLGQLLGEWTGTRWVIAVSQAEGMPTLAEQDAERSSALRNEVAAHPLVRAVLETFPGATIAAVREHAGPADYPTGSRPGAADEVSLPEEPGTDPSDEASAGEDGP
ncbi:MAG: DNA polymerase III subunit gamma/tau [Alphaproteobacteria bacterium]|nr:DNA polymerase III subunit gamma/tau [Alphaproteobacteria bacterium]